MESKVINRIVLISNENEICFCDKSFYKTCISRIAGNLPCQEMMVRFTPVNRGDDLGEGDGDFLGVMKSSRQFSKTLDHLDRMK